ncbi:MAG: glycosyltransferase [Actinomycetota bacterium]|nr:glycosyltransferase [Actinomycetota bacterium]
MGQLNERLDMDILDAAAATSVPITVVGPRVDRDPEFSFRLSAFLSHPNVTWVGQLPTEELGPYIATASLGITPYADSEFNRSSFPLKTLEYLAGGLRVVATDLPAVRWLSTELITVAFGPEDFAAKVLAAARAPQGNSEGLRRQAFASAHSWQARAASLLDLVGI